MTLLLILACGDKDTTPSDSGGATDSGGEVENSAPTAPGVAISPAVPQYGQALTCAIETDSVDDDGDEITYTYTWTVDGVDAGIDDAEVAASTTLPWETWSCEVVASDGELDSEPGWASVQPLDECESLTIDVHSQWPMALPVQTTMNALAIEPGNAYTLETWFRLDSASDDGSVIFSKGDGETQGHSGNLNLMLALKHNRIDFSTYSSHSGNDCDYLAVDIEVDASGTWQHVAATLDTNTMEKALFLNGTEIARCTGTGINGVQDGPFFLGAMAWGNMQTGQVSTMLPFQGRLDEARFSKTVRYTADFTPARWHETDSDDIALWHLNDMSDSSGNGFELQTMGGATVDADASVCDL